MPSMYASISALVTVRSAPLRTARSKVAEPHSTGLLLSVDRTPRENAAFLKSQLCCWSDAPNWSSSALTVLT
jgi:hypothetical protein